MAWQPIETAPKDGQEIVMGFWTGYGQWHQWIGLWDKNTRRFRAYHWGGPPTHWMPIPEPPDVKGA